ncbi:MAG: 4-hydroxybenzoate octaprenyltransferase [Nevskia sp.]|nr:4-hydroxybenzoate octaprenyltransferase [Nevskia sp.]
MPSSRPFRARCADYAVLMRLDRPIGIGLLLWPTLWALWFAAGGVPPLDILGVFVFGTVLMRSAGCVINDFADRKFDPHVERTKNRPLAAGRVSVPEALLLFAALCVMALLLALRLNSAALLLSIPAVLLAASYPFAKRYHALPQAHLGIAFSWGIPMAFAAVNGGVDWSLAGLLMAANLCWVIAYDTLYAMVDREDDRKIGVKSSAILFGRYDLAVVAALNAAALVLLVLAGFKAGAHGAYFGGLIVAAILLSMQQWQVRDRGRTACFTAFLQNNRVGAVIFTGLLAASVLARF